MLLWVVTVSSIRIIATCWCLTTGSGFMIQVRSKGCVCLQWWQQENSATGCRECQCGQECRWCSNEGCQAGRANAARCHSPTCHHVRQVQEGSPPWSYIRHPWGHQWGSGACRDALKSRSVPAQDRNVILISPGSSLPLLQRFFVKSLKICAKLAHSPSCIASLLKAEILSKTCSTLVMACAGEAWQCFLRVLCAWLHVHSLSSVNCIDP